MTDYGAVPTLDPDTTAANDDDDEPEVGNSNVFFGIDWTFVWRFLEGGHLTRAQKKKIKSRLEELDYNHSAEYFCIHAESVRQIAYFAFWAQVLVAGFFTKFFVDPELVAHSDLMAMFGYNNVCVLWDYSPSREYTAMLYPIFEYAFFFYVIFDYIHLRLVIRNTRAGLQWILNFANFFLGVKLTLIAWFRMIFIYAVTQPDVKYGVRGVVGHTLAFFGFQFALILVAFENILFINYTNIEYPFLGKWTKRLSWVYLGLFIPNTVFQMWFVFGIFWGYPTLDVQGPDANPTHQLIIWIVDRMWLVLVGLMPFIFAEIGKKTQAHVRVTFELNSTAWNDITESRRGSIRFSKRSIEGLQKEQI